MIFVERKQEPPDFDQRVRKPGRRFLRNTPKPTHREFSKHSYWRRVVQDLHDAYDSICAYTCHWIARDTGWGSVEHFVSKSAQPALAYEWNNFRLVCGRMNGRKGSHDDVLDPFEIRELTFVIRFPSLQVGVAGGISDELREATVRTVARLGLNDEVCISSRLAYLRSYCNGETSLDYLRRRAPFIHREIVRQGLETKICEMMRFSGAAQRDRVGSR